MVADHEAGGSRAAVGAQHLDVPADQRVGQAGNADDPAVVEDHRLLDLGADNLAVLADELRVEQNGEGEYLLIRFASLSA